MTYPNVLAMRHLKARGRLTPEWQMKLDAAIGQGYQRLLTFEVAGGGFDWYGRAPAKTLLTAYGLMLLEDMAEVFPVDPAVIRRARRLLRERQGADGGWMAGNEAAPNGVAAGDLLATAYVTWALLESGVEEPRGVAYLERHQADATEPFTLALVANALVLAESPEAPRVLERLESMGVERGDAAFWRAGGSRGEAADVEATALAALALLRDGRSFRTQQALAALVRAKDPEGGWHSTQSTVLAMKALLEAAREGVPEQPVPIRLRVNGHEVEAAALTAQNFDVLQQVNVTRFLRPGENEIEVECDRRIAVQASARCWIPWERVPAPPADAPLEIAVRYDKDRLAREDRLRCEVELRYRGAGTFMVIADLGVPPGFEVDTASFERMVAAGRIDRFERRGRHISLYFGALRPGEVVPFSYDLRPKFPVVVQTPRSQAYEYYAPDRRCAAGPLTIEVAE